jgi:hypothetical protein
VSKPDPVRRFKTGLDIIRLAVMLFVWFPLSVPSVRPSLGHGEMLGNVYR